MPGTVGGKVEAGMLVFDRLVLDVTNLERSLRFYTEELDFQVVGSIAWGSHPNVIIQLGAFHVLLLEQSDAVSASYQLPKGPPIMGLSDARIEARVSSLNQSGVDIVAPLSPSPWGGRSMMILDPDGYLIMVQEPPQGDSDTAAEMAF